MDEFVPVGDLRALLLEQGHRLGDPDNRPGSLSIEPPEDVYLTIALKADVVLYRRWRERYFLCKPDAGVILDSSSVTDDFRRRWMAMIDGVMAGLPRDVIAGLATWTASRLLRFHRVFAWADKRVGLYQDYRGKACEEVSESLGSTIGPGLLRRHLDAEASAVAAVLETNNPEFPFLIATYFLFASQNFLEICFTVEDGSEVYTMHHHDKVIVSIPDPVNRLALVAELSSNPAHFTADSNYELREEPEDMTEEEYWGET
jgi:hypothetical protein